MLPEWFGSLGYAGWPLAACSVIAVAIIFERGFFVLRSTFRRHAHYAELTALLAEHREKQKHVRNEVIDLLVDDLYAKFANGLPLLQMIGNLSPMLGLFGTILGVINAFRTISETTGPVSPQLISGGLWEAMLTTAVGLGIALPVILMAYLFQRHAENSARKAAAYLQRVSLTYEPSPDTNSSSMTVQHDHERTAA